MKQSLISILGLFCALGCSHVKGELSAPPPRNAQFSVPTVWTHRIDPDPRIALGADFLDFGAVAVDEFGTRYVASSKGTLTAISAKGGVVLWQNRYAVSVTGKIAFASSRLLVGLEDGRLLCLNKNSGELIWEFESNAPIQGAVAHHDGRIFFVNANNRFFALNEKDGSLLWRKERPRPSDLALYGQSKPLLVGDSVYVGFSDGTFSAYSQANGTVLWTKVLDEKSRFRDIDADPIFDEGIIYLSTASSVFAVRDDGSMVWQKEISGTRNLAVFQDSLYVAAADKVYRLSKNDGFVLWENPVSESRDILISSLALGKNAVYVAASGFALVVLDRKNGKYLHNFDTGSNYTAAPVLTEGELTVLSNKSTVSVYRVKDAPLL